MGEQGALALRAASELALPSLAMTGAQAHAAATPAPGHAGSVYVIRKAVAVHADSIVYVLERASDRAQAWVEVRDHDAAAANTANMVNAIGAKLLSDAGDEITPAWTGAHRRGTGDFSTFYRQLMMARKQISKFVEPSDLAGEWSDCRGMYFWHHKTPVAMKRVIEKTMGTQLRRDTAETARLSYGGATRGGGELQAIWLRFEAVIDARKLYSLVVETDRAAPMGVQGVVYQGMPGRPSQAGAANSRFHPATSPGRMPPPRCSRNSSA